MNPTERRETPVENNIERYLDNSIVEILSLEPAYYNLSLDKYLSIFSVNGLVNFPTYFS